MNSISNLKKNARNSFSRLIDPIPMPDFLEIQTKSYNDFLQAEVAPGAHKEQGLQQVLKEIYPIYSYDGNTCLEFVSYSLGTPKYEIEECQSRGLTYSSPLRVTLRLKRSDWVKEETVYVGNIPRMTPQGSFVINGAERVIVSQLHRTPGICFEKIKRSGNVRLFMFRIIPNRGSWLEAEFNRKGQIHFYLDKKRSRRKLLATTLLRALGYGTDKNIIQLFSETEEVSISTSSRRKNLEGRFLSSPVVDQQDTVLIKAYVRIDEEVMDILKKAKIKQVEVLKPGPCVEYLVNMLQIDPTNSKKEAEKFIYKKLRPGDPPTEAKASSLIERRFFDRRRFDLGAVGRFKINQKFGLSTNREELKKVTLRKKDIALALKYLMELNAGEPGAVEDDIDHLGMRRIAMVGELLQEQCRIALTRLERMVKDKMGVYEVSSDNLTPHKLINPKAMNGVFRDFFGRSQLSQFMDQTNPLAELAHKRRLTALGPGGLSRKRAGFDVRDVQPSHYGRICPIESPEGPNIGLIASLSTFARVNELGFIVTPYRKVEKGRITKQVKHLSADEEEQYVIAQANVRVDDKGNLLDDMVKVRKGGDTVMAPAETVEFVDVSPRQLVSVAAGLIPFLEHDDANRALMGSNMQRQAVPLLTTEVPLVATGLEKKVARDSRVIVTAEADGVVTKVDADSITIDKRVYPIKKFARTNAGTCNNQRPLVTVGQKVKKGQVIADGAATSGGELALGKNVMVAFMPWRGYNFEDAIVISERLVKEDTYTSIHIEKYEIGARDTKLGREEITRDIPGVGEEALMNLDAEGVIHIGAEVKPKDILVGKITPKSETELFPEERLLRAIFGEKAADVKDTSLRAASGVEGIVMDVKVFSRKDSSDETEEKKEEKSQVRDINSRHRKEVQVLKAKRQEKILKILHKKKMEGSIVAVDTGLVLIPAHQKITLAMLQKLEEHDYQDIEIEGDNQLIRQFKKAIMESEDKLEELDLKRNQELEQVKIEDELEPGMIKKVQVYIATKRKLSVGDKMSGRHGNKGVIAKILPEEDLPFLADGTPVDIVLNPLGVPSRMNVGQVLETHLGWAAKALGLTFSTPVFDGIKEEQIVELLSKAKLSKNGKAVLYDGRTGEPFGAPVVIGYIYMMKLHHLVAAKIHARAIGPYSLVTQQPLGGKAQFGGQRFGEMEVWALEAYGAAYALQEMLTVKSDDIMGRTRIYESIVKGSNKLEAGTPESFNVLIKELRSLALDVRPEKAPPEAE
ncbi:MAG: DNA-directed RNA polymerase subunit beta [Candidatus Euphemobacter frigidus]|nr:DNA-directed RNA polymerase subunit beta [Candidatus Euphemobacter frigidus]MDP8275328.1 DNA-directed RNA polymerase subunit beta [Candidatus Euphemobacter frigidus]